MPKPQRASQAEGLLLGKGPSPDLWAQAAEAMAGEIATHSDLSASADFRKALIRSLAPKVLARAVTRIEGGNGR